MSVSDCIIAGRCNRSPIDNRCTPCLSGAVGRGEPSQCGALRAPHPGICMVRPSGPNLADLAFYCREAAEALKARNIPAHGKHAESVRRPGYNGDHVRVPRPLWPQSAKLTGAKEAMEPEISADLCGCGFHRSNHPAGAVTDRLPQASSSRSPKSKRSPTSPLSPTRHSPRSRKSPQSRPWVVRRET